MLYIPCFICKHLYKDVSRIGEVAPMATAITPRATLQQQAQQAPRGRTAVSTAPQKPRQAQVNARIDAELKEAGDAALAAENIQEIATPVAVDLSDVLLAGRFRSQVYDFEDALIAAAAMRCHADVLVTNDERFLRHCPVNAMDAADALVYLTMADAVPNT